MTRSQTPIVGASVAAIVVAGWVMSTVRPPDATGAPCDDAGADPWVHERYDLVMSGHGLVQYAVSRFGQPLSCEGAVTMEFDGMSFGRLTLTFADGVTFVLETLPPEVAITTLRRDGGFEDDAALREAFTAYVAGVGVEVDWSAPEVSDEDGERVETYWDPEAGLNGSASLIFAGARLVGVRFSLAP